MTEKEYNAAMSRLNDRYLMESTMTNEDYLRNKKAIEIEYLKWVNNGRKKVVNNKAINHVLNKFNWEDKRKFLKNILFDIHTK